MRPKVLPVSRTPLDNSFYKYPRPVAVCLLEKETHPSLACSRSAQGNSHSRRQASKLHKRCRGPTPMQSVKETEAQHEPNLGTSSQASWHGIMRWAWKETPGCRRLRLRLGAGKLLEKTVLTCIVLRRSALSRDNRLWRRQSVWWTGESHRLGRMDDALRHHLAHGAPLRWRPLHGGKIFPPAGGWLRLSEPDQ
jgi:hypothetical protein